jgi:hypothetical protein
MKNVAALLTTREARNLQKEGSMNEFTLLKRIEGANGTRALNIIARDDGFYVYREDRIYEDEEVYPYWIEGYPLSGLFVSAEEAEKDARRSID